MATVQINFQIGQSVKNIWEASDIHLKIGRIVSLAEENGKIEVRVEYQEDPPKIVRVYREGENLHHIVPCSKGRLISKKVNRSQELCSICNKVRQVKVHKNGQAVCSTCYKRDLRPKEKCSLCGEVRRVAAHKNGQAVCGTCYQRELRLKKVKK